MARKPPTPAAAPSITAAYASARWQREVPAPVWSLVGLALLVGGAMRLGLRAFRGAGVFSGMAYFDAMATDAMLFGAVLVGLWLLVRGGLSDVGTRAIALGAPVALLLSAVVGLGSAVGINESLGPTTAELQARLRAGTLGKVERGEATSARRFLQTRTNRLSGGDREASLRFVQDIYLSGGAAYPARIRRGDDGGQLIEVLMVRLPADLPEREKVRDSWQAFLTAAGSGQSTSAATLPTGRDWWLTMPADAR